MKRASTWRLVGGVRLRGARLILALCALASSARAQDFVDTRLTATFGDDDVLHRSQDGLSPAPSFGDRPQYQLFYDNLNTRYTGRETLTHLVAYRKLPGYLKHVTTEAAFVMRFELDTTRLYDTGSYVRIGYHPFAAAPNDGLSLVLFPFDSERFRVGYLYDLSLSGSEFLPRANFYRSPAAKLSFVRGISSFYVGFKATPSAPPLRLDLGGTTSVDVVDLSRPQYAALAGAGFRLFGDTLQVDLSGGYFQNGRLDVTAYPSARLYSLVSAGRVAYHVRMPVLESIDMQLYANDPNQPFFAFRPVRYVPGELGYLASLEGVYTANRVGDSDDVGGLTFEHGVAAAALGRIQYDYWRFELTGMLRQAAFLARTSPDLFPFLSTPEDARSRPELFVAAVVDRHFPLPHLTVSLSGGVQRPAAIAVVGEDGASEGTVVLRHDRLSTTVAGTRVRPVVASRAQVRFDVSEMLYTMAWVQYVYDKNVPEGADVRAHQLGFGLMGAARF